MRVLSLCSGIGGIDLAAEAVGCEIAGQVEIDPFCQAVLAKHWPRVKRLGDIKEVQGDEFGEIDLLAAGFPCQPSSEAGKRLGSADPRNLWPHVARLIRAIHPRWVVLENVPGLLSVETGRLFGHLLWNLAEAGYDALWEVHSAADVGAPHLRERVFIVAYPRNQRHQRGQEVGWEAQRWAEYTGDAVADTRCQGQPARGIASGTASLGEISHDWLAGSSATVADSASQGPQGPIGAKSSILPTTARHRSAGVGQADASGSRPSLWDWSAEQNRSRAPVTGSASGKVESGFCGSAHGLSRRLDGHRWPARPDEAQEAWEAPRIVTERIPNRAARLKALGNAVVPQQILPVFQAIMALEAEEVV